MKRFVARSSQLARRVRRRSPLSSKRTPPLTSHNLKNIEGAKIQTKPEPPSVKSVDSATKKPEAKLPSESSSKPAEKSKALAEEPPLTNPFPLLAHATENIDLSSRLRAFSNNFAVIGALWCTLSISALSFSPIDDVYKDTERIDNITPAQANSNSTYLSAVRWRRATTRAVSPPEPASERPCGGQRKRPPILVKYFGIPETYLEDIYVACWSASFFTSAIGLGLSTVIAGIVAATAPAYIKIFVRRNSEILLALPVCQGLSSGFAAVGLSVGLDEARGEPISWIGYVGTVAGGAIVGSSTMKVLKGYKASRAAGKLSTPKDG